MSFLTLRYCLFLTSLLGLYWLLPQVQLRLWMLLVASLLFYSTFNIQYVPLLLVMTWITYQLGQAIGAAPDWRNDDWQFAQQDWNRRRIKLLTIGVGLHLFFLFTFKMIGVFLLSAIAPVIRLDFALSESAIKTLNEITPFGISYFCFECISYLVDVYRGTPASRNFVRFATYKLFFAKLISGPITRYSQFISQIQTQSFPKAEQITEGLWLIACGAVKKGLVADHLGIFVNLSFDNLARAGSGDLWLAIFAYGFQIYLDFSSYVDIARGTALLLGFNLPQNFEFPYFTTNIADFWRRWHITLGDWLRNYLYFPLGGSRKGFLRTCLNLMIIMLVCGLWHGATWGFLAWGALHGVALVIHRLTDRLSKQIAALSLFWQSLPGILLAWLITQTTVFGSWVLFRLPNLKDAGLVFTSLWGKAADPQFITKVYGETLAGFYPPQMTIALLAISGAMAIAYLFHRGLKLQLNWYLKLALVPLCLYGVFLFGSSDGLKFIYFDY
jgi:alginate O-acetyltransferase complex protein AlgI